jgi:hypothetical protein
MMKKKCIECLNDTLSNWSDANVLTVPGVMYQVVCREETIENNMKYRFHWFLDCTETYVHNHRNNFDTYCLEGKYIQTLWEIINDGITDAITYKFPRTSGNKFGSKILVPGVLRVIRVDKHYPENVLHVNTDQFHTISSIPGSNNQALTFVARQICSSAAKHTYVLSSSEVINEPIGEMRPATPDECQQMYDKLNLILSNLIRS